MLTVSIQERTFQFGREAMHFVQGLELHSSLVSVERQLIRSATSIGANVAEAQGASSRKDFLNFLVIARKSGFETLYWLRMLQVSHQDQALEDLFSECTTIVKILSSIILKIRASL